MRWLLVLLVGCSSGSLPLIVEAGSDGQGASLPPPVNHRAMAMDCPTTRPASMPTQFPGPCMMDSDCTMGMNGRCVSASIGSVKCSYDECTKDSDCGSSSVCDCRESTNADANTCQHGNCKTDMDCASGFCSPSAIDLTVNCRMGVPAGSFGFFCHAKGDDCNSDSDCASNSAIPPKCIFDPNAQKWSCQKMMCTK
jgi:hypothetical protein